MGSQGVFRDDFYNAVSALANSQAAAYTAGTGVVPASSLAGAGDCYIVFSGQAGAVTATTDSAINIIAQLQQAVAAAYKAQIAGFGAGVNPPSGVPNLFNLSWTLTLNNQNTSAGAITTTGGAGVTMAALGGLSTTTVAIATVAIYVVTVTSPTTLTLTRVQ